MCVCVCVCVCVVFEELFVVLTFILWCILIHVLFFKVYHAFFEEVFIDEVQIALLYLKYFSHFLNQKYFSFLTFSVILCLTSGNNCPESLSWIIVYLVSS